MERSEPDGVTQNRIGQIAVIAASVAVLAAFVWPVVGVVVAGAAVVVAQSPRVTRNTRVLVFALAAATLLAVVLQLTLALPVGGTLGREVVVPA